MGVIIRDVIMIEQAVQVIATTISAARAIVVSRNNQILITASSTVAVSAEEKLLTKIQNCALTTSVLKEVATYIKALVLIIACIINKH